MFSKLIRGAPLRGEGRRVLLRANVEGSKGRDEHETTGAIEGHSVYLGEPFARSQLTLRGSCQLPVGKQF